MRQAEHDMEVRGREKFPFSGGDPTLACLSLALVAMTIAAAIEGDDREAPQLRAFVAMTAERCRAATHDRAHHLHLLKADSVSMTVDEVVALRAKDVGHLHRWAGSSVSASFWTASRYRVWKSKGSPPD